MHQITMQYNTVVRAARTPLLLLEIFKCDFGLLGSLKINRFTWKEMKQVLRKFVLPTTGSEMFLIIRGRLFCPCIIYAWFAMPLPLLIDFSVRVTV